MNKQKTNYLGKFSPAVVIIAAVCIGIYLFALIQGAVRIYLSVEQQRITAGQDFENIADRALFAGNLGFMNEAFIEAMNNGLAINRTIAAIIISGPDGEYAFEKQKNGAIKWVNNSPRFIDKFVFSGESLYKPLRIQGLRNVNIQAVALVFDFWEMTKILKETLFLIMIGFMIAFFTLLIDLLITKSSGNKNTETVYAERKPAAVHRQPAIQKDYKETNNEISVKNTDNNENLINTENNLDNLNNLDKNEEHIPNGLYSPRSHIGWEEYTKDRLESELHRCSSAEKDLVLIIIEFTNILDDAAFRQAADEAVTFFASRDLLFEMGKQGISVIYPGIDLETGLAKAQKFQERILEKLVDSSNINSGLCIGLSSRSGRLLNSGRLMLEAAEALNKAKTDPESSIIAFKSDPEKYRAYISKQA